MLIVYLAIACLMIVILLDIFLFFLLQIGRQEKQAEAISADSTTKEEV